MMINDQNQKQTFLGWCPLGVHDEIPLVQFFLVSEKQNQHFINEPNLSPKKLLVAVGAIKASYFPGLFQSDYFIFIVV